MTSLLNKHQTWSQQLNEDIPSQQQEEDDNNSSSAPVRKRTRATADQLSVLEDTFAVNVSPNSKLRKQLAEQLQMSERSIQIWFQNRRAKVKHMQKRAQMQMHQASIRAQLYQYHQQQQQQQQQQPSILPSYQQHPYYYNTATARLASNHLNRAQSVDAVHHQQQQQQQQYHTRPVVMPQQSHLFTPASSVPPNFNSATATPPPMSYPQYYHGQWLQNEMPLSRQSMPPQPYPFDINQQDASLIGLDFPEYIHGQVSPSPSPLHKQQQNIPTLISVPDAGPTAVLATSNTKKQSPSPSIHSNHESSPESTSVQTVDPASLMMQENKDVTEKEEEPKQPLTQEEDEEPKDLYLSATTLTIGTWHRLKMHETDLVCVYRPDTRTFAWHIVDGGCHFKMEVTQDAVSSIEFITDDNEALADVHFDISEPPLFYMESTTTTIVEDSKKKTSNNKKASAEPEVTTTPVWVQCSDFTEGKQASRFFRHTLKGISHHIKQELLALIHNHEETRRLVHFTEAPIMTVPTNMYHHHPPPPPPPHFIPQHDGILMPQGGFMNPNTMYWQPSTQVDSMPCELYMN